jgi:hypothetical protein
MSPMLSGLSRSAADLFNDPFPGEPSPSGRIVVSEDLELSNFGSALLARIEFEASLQGDQLGPTIRNEFKSDLYREITQINRWAAENNWLPLPWPEFRVVVSDRFNISRSLVPAWSGRQGHMEFPTRRVVARNAAIAHELVHVFFPNGNRFLAEGLAIYLQAEIGGNPAFPNFGRPLHELVRELAPRMTLGFRPGEPSSLEAIHLTELDAIATPNPLTLKVGTDVYGEEPRGQAHVYPLAGSFVQHLVETRRIEAFRCLYGLTPLVPWCQDAGATERWMEAYGSPLQSLEFEWKSMIASWHHEVAND